MELAKILHAKRTSDLIDEVQKKVNKFRDKFIGYYIFYALLDGVFICKGVQMQNFQMLGFGRGVNPEDAFRNWFFTKGINVFGLDLNVVQNRVVYAVPVIGFGEPKAIDLEYLQDEYRQWLVQNEHPFHRQLRERIQELRIVKSLSEKR